MKIEWYKTCNSCGHFEKGETAYIAFALWYCSKCNSHNLHVVIRM